MIKDKLMEINAGDISTSNNKFTYVLPRIDSIFENKDLINKINMIRYTVQ
jgi:hypothetical protein